MGRLASLCLLGLALALVLRASRPLRDLLGEVRHLERALASLQTSTPQGERLDTLRAALTALRARSDPPAVLPALEATLAMVEGRREDARTHLGNFAAADTPLARAARRFLVGASVAPPDAPGDSDPFALVLDGWRIAYGGDTEALGALLERLPGSTMRRDFHVLYLLTLHAALRAPEDFEEIGRLLELTLEALGRPPTLRHLGFGPDAFDPVLVAAPDGALTLRTGEWRGALVTMRESQLVRRADLHLGLAAVHQLAGRPQRSLFHAQILEDSYQAAVDARGMTDALERLLHPRPFRSRFRAVARQHGMDPFLLYAVAREESHFRADAISSAGARGLMQVVPSTARWIADRRNLPRPGAKDLLDPAVNLDLGAWYLGHLAGKFWYKPTKIAWTLAAYNAGLRPATRWLKEWKARRKEDPELRPEEVIDFPETRGYVVKVLRSRDAYARLYADDPEG